MFEFDSAHHLPNYEGKCAEVHGHTYKMEVVVSGSMAYGADNRAKLATKHMVMDFGRFKKVVQDSVVSICDHKDLNTIFEYPTAEEMVCFFYHRLRPEFAKENVRLESVKLWETPTCFAECRGEFQ
jgi:6-pyruvoyltetrahydropterin/6-carboxytetrahydropterin synthase